MPPPPSSDPLKTFAAHHSGDAFRVLVEAHAGVVTGVAHRITGSRETAEEVTQDVFTLLARRAVALARGDAPLAAWLHRTATYMALNARKREKRRHSMLERAMHELPLSAEPPADTPEWMPHLDAALNTLTDPDRQLLLLHHAAGYTLPEAAAQLGLSTEAVKKRSQRAMERLRTVMQRIRSGAEGPTGPQGPPMTDTPVPVTACLATAFVPAAISTAQAASIAANALAASKTAGTGAVLLNVLHTMSYTKAAAAIAACIALANLGWQEYEITTARREVETVRREVAGKANASAAAAVSASPKNTSSDKKAVPHIEFSDLAEMIAGIEQRQSIGTMARLSAIVESMSEEDALRLLDVSLTANVPPSARDGIRKILLGCLSRTDPARSLSLSMKFWEAASGRQAMEIIFDTGNHFSAWVARDAPAALKWLEQSEQSGVLASREVDGASPLRILRGAALLALAETSPDQAKILLTRFSPEEKMAALNHAAGRMDPHEDNWKPLLNLMLTLPAEDRVESVCRLASNTGAHSKEALLELTAQAGLSPEGTARALASGISESSQNQPLTDSLQWLEKHTPPGTQEEARMYFLLQGGAWYHATEAVPALADFVGRGLVSDSQLEAFTNNTIRRVREESGAVLQMAAAITDPAIRKRATTDTVTQWAARNAAEASAAVKNLTIPEEEKAALFKAAAR